MDSETFRALARSSPWLWSSVRLARTAVGRDDGEQVRAWLQRPARMRVEPVTDGGPESSSRPRQQGWAALPPEGSAVPVDVGAAGWRPYPGATADAAGSRPYLVDERNQLGRGRAVLTTVSAPGSQAAPPPRPVFRYPQDQQAPQPVWRSDGLVARRPDGFDVVYDDPMYENYQWVAMLDPVELADGDEQDPDEDLASLLADVTPGGHGERRGSRGLPGGERAGNDLPPGVEVLELTERDFFGRPAIMALVRPTIHYGPRCACCPLLYSAVSVAIDRAEGAPALEPLPVFAETFRVVLDRATGICVQLRDVGGDHDGAGFDVEIEEVDAGYPDSLFASP